MLISACGVICSDCPAYHAADKGTRHQDRVVEAWHRIYQLNLTPERITCGGCLGSDADLFYTQGNCQARRCCKSKGFETCAECGPAPSGARDLAMPAGSRLARPDCALLEKAQSVWDGVPQLVDKLSARDFETYARPYCDHRLRLAALRQTFKGQAHD